MPSPPPGRRALRAAGRRLLLVAPVTLLLAIRTIYIDTRGVTKTVNVMIAAPLSLVGAFWLIRLLEFDKSVRSSTQPSAPCGDGGDHL